MGKKLKKWNGRGHGKYNNGHIFVAAYSQKHATELINISCKTFIGVNEIRYYYSDCWGNSMDDITPEEPCVYVSDRYYNKPFRIL